MHVSTPAAFVSLKIHVKFFLYNMTHELGYGEFGLLPILCGILLKWVSVLEYLICLIFVDSGGFDLVGPISEVGLIWCGLSQRWV